MKKFFGILGIVVPTYAMAGHTALNVMPIADVLGHREAIYAYTASAVQGDKRYSHAHGLEIGLFDKAEIGFDNDFMGETVWNAKVSLWDNPKCAPGTACSVGVMNLHRNHKPDWVAVGRKDFNSFRVHGGIMLNDGVRRGILGADFAAAPGVTIMLDHIAGAGEYSWGGFSYAPDAIPGLSVGAAFGVPNRKSDGTQHYVTAGYGFRF